MTDLRQHDGTERDEPAAAHAYAVALYARIERPHVEHHGRWAATVKREQHELDVRSRLGPDRLRLGTNEFERLGKSPRQQQRPAVLALRQAKDNPLARLPASEAGIFDGNGRGFDDGAQRVRRNR